MSQEYYVFLAEIVIASTDDFDITVSATPYTYSLVAGSYFLRGDGALDDIMEEFQSQINGGASGINIDSISVTFDVDAANAPFVATLDADGAWQLDGTGTYDLTQLGFTSLPISSDGAHAISTTLGSKYAWCAPEPPTADDPAFSGQVSQVRTVGGQVYTTELGGPYADRSISLEWVDPERTLKVSNSSDTNATFEAFWEYARTGKRIEVHKTTISSGSTLGALSSSTLVGTYVMDQATAASWRPQRLSPGVEVYSFTLSLLEYAA